MMYTFQEIHRFFSYATSYMGHLGPAHGENLWMELTTDEMSLYVENTYGKPRKDGLFTLFLTFERDIDNSSRNTVSTTVDEDSNLKEVVKALIKRALEKQADITKESKRSEQLELDLDV